MIEPESGIKIFQRLGDDAVLSDWQQLLGFAASVTCGEVRSGVVVPPCSCL